MKKKKTICTYSAQDIDFIKANAHKGRKWLAEAMGRPLYSIIAALKNRGIKTGNNGRFEKGLNPWNAGRTGVRVSPKSEFKKGNLPPNTMKDGAIVIRNDRDIKTGQLRRYKWIRIAKAKWVLYHRYLWEQHTGPIPPRHVVRFINGDRMDCRVENLEMISMAENARRNHNNKKRKATMNLLKEEGDHPSSNLTDNYVASTIAGKHYRKELLKQPEIIDLKRTQLILNRKINEKLRETI